MKRVNPQNIMTALGLMTGANEVISIISMQRASRGPWRQQQECRRFWQPWLSRAPFWCCLCASRQVVCWPNGLSLL